MKPIDLTFYLVTDPDLSLGRTEEEVVRRAVAAGVTMVQYRDKDTATRRMIEKTRVLAAVCGPAGVPLVVNDRLDVALAGGADGVHLGQEDMDPEDARKICPNDFIVGVSVTTVDEVKRAVDGGADYLGANGVFPTGTKTDLGDPLLLEGVREIVKASHRPVVGIGGIHSGNAGDVLKAGASGVAVVSFIVGHDDIEGQCAALLGSIHQGEG